MELLKEDILSGKSLRVATVQMLPFVEVLGDDETVFAGSGFCFEILNALMKTYNFSITIDVPKDKAYGAQLENGLWNGIIEMILKNETDIGIGSFTMTHVRYQAIDYTVPYFEEQNGILIPAAKPEYPSTVFMKPFQPQVWLALIGILILLSLILWTRSKIFDSTILPPNHGRKTYFAFIYGVLLTQSGQKVPGKLRFLAAIWFLSSVVLIHAYVGTLISYLSVPRSKPVIRSLDDVPSSGLGWFVWKGSDLESTFWEATNGLNRVIGDGLRKYPKRLTESFILAEQGVINGSFVFMHSLGAISFSAQQDFITAGRKCRLNVAKKTLDKAHQAFILPKNSPLRMLFDKKIQMMIDTGLVEYWRVKYLSFKDYCGSESHSAGSRRLTLNDMKGAFILWMIGATIASFAFIIENISYFIERFVK